MKTKTLLLFLIFSLFFLGCSTIRPPALPDTHAQKLPWGAIDLDIKSKAKYSIKNSLGAAITQKAGRYSNSEQSVPFDILTLSGGGSRGAFGTGLIIGWSDSGKMPEFDIITGISTGAIMAPFVFLGGDELNKIKYFYTEMYTEDVFESSWINFFGGGYIMNAEPLKEKFIKTFDKTFLEKVAVEHKNGRRLYIGTTNVDTGQLVVWDMGAIAASDRSDKYQRFSEIVYASSALPIYLPPQYILVNVGDEKYYQMHVDGGIYSQVFMIGLMVNWDKILDFKTNANKNFDTTLYTVANRKYRQRDIYSPIEQSPFDIIEAYVLIEMDLLFDRSLYRLYSSSKREDIKFRMATIPEKMKDIIVDPTKFEPEKLMELYQVGYKEGLRGIDWKEKVSFHEYDNNQ